MTGYEAIISRIDREFCEHENEAGRRCSLGPKHQGPCLFRPFVPTKAQDDVLDEIARIGGVRKFQCIGSSTVAVLKALYRRGFVGIRYVNSRAWDAWLTPAGRRLLDDRAR